MQVSQGGFGSLKLLFENPVFLSAITSWFIAQALKAFIVALRPRAGKRRGIVKALLWETGGMPSSHAALVMSMSFSVAFRSGFGSDLFCISFFMTMIVIRDAVGVRRSAGQQAKALNIMGRHAQENLKFDYIPVKEVFGHTPLEVAVGSLLGIFIACAYYYL